MKTNHAHHMTSVVPHFIGFTLHPIITTINMDLLATSTKYAPHISTDPPLFPKKKMYSVIRYQHNYGQEKNGKCTFEMVILFL